MSGAQPMLQVDQLVKRYGGLLATDNVSLSLQPGELHAIIGPNGAGKTTLIGQLGGEIPPLSGRVVFNGEDVTALGPRERLLQAHLALADRLDLAAGEDEPSHHALDDLVVVQRLAIEGDGLFGHRARLSGSKTNGGPSLGEARRDLTSARPLRG